MKVHTRQIPPEGKHIEGEDPASVLDLHDPTTQPCGPLRYALDVGLSEGGLFATGHLEGDFRLQCVKCLEPFEYKVEVPNFACQVELEGAEEVDLTESLREDIVLALPAHPHCDWSGSKRCSGLHVLPEQPLPAETPRPVWDALDNLKLES